MVKARCGADGAPGDAAASFSGMTGQGCDLGGLVTPAVLFPAGTTLPGKRSTAFGIVEIEGNSGSAVGLLLAVLAEYQALAWHPAT